MITPRSYAEKLAKSESLVAEKLKDYLKEGNVDNVHDLRTSIRRMLATTTVLPKKMRGKKDSRKYLADHEKLLRINAEVRDLDIILEKMQAHKEDPGYDELAKDLKESRESALNRARKFASSMKDDDAIAVEAKDLSGGALTKHFRRTANKLARKMEKRVRVVMREPKNKMELHRLREDARRLRYVLELDNSPTSSKSLSVLASWQEMLGVIHDADIFIERFKDEKEAAKIRALLNSELSDRGNSYEKFRAVAKESPSLELPR